VDGLVVTHRHTAPSLLDGANLHQLELAQAFLHEQSMRVDRVSIAALLGEPTISDANFIYCAADPFAHFLFHARERRGWKCRIIRSVQTAAWAGYLLQESLCRPLEREDDITIYPSLYCLRSYDKWFARRGIGRHLIRRFAPVHVPAPVAPREKRPYRAGYFGRLSLDKNFITACEAFAAISAVEPQARFLIVGIADPNHFSTDDVKAILRRSGIERSCDLVGGLPHVRAMESMANVSALLFPSTSTIESYGRVIVEAGALQARCVAADHAAAPELLMPALLVPVVRKSGNLSCYENHPTGSVDAAELAARVLTPSDDRDAISILDPVADVPSGLLRRTPPDKKFATVPRILGSIMGMPEVSPQEALEQIACHIALSRCFVRKGLEPISKALLANSSSPRRTAGFISRSLGADPDLSQLGGWALESGHLLGFRPILRLGKGEAGV
jgi:glycosyltransferase involved in cell wall biosynthesis